MPSNKEIARFNKIRKQVRENNEKLKKCSLHDFDTDNYKFGQKLKCKKCGAEIPIEYYAGYKDLKEKLLDTERIIEFINQYYHDGLLLPFQKELLRLMLNSKLEVKEHYDIEGLPKILMEMGRKK